MSDVSRPDVIPNRFSDEGPYDGSIRGAVRRINLEESDGTGTFLQAQVLRDAMFKNI
jgi:hypothetical protein